MVREKILECRLSEKRQNLMLSLGNLNETIHVTGENILGQRDFLLLRKARLEGAFF